jgi:hypothetical protein
MRFITPLVFFVAAVGVAVHNARADGELVAFSFLGSLHPSLAGDLALQGHATVGVLGVFGVVTLIRALLRGRADAEG